MIRSVSQKLNEYEASIRRLVDTINRTPRKQQAGKLVELANACRDNKDKITTSWDRSSEKGIEMTLNYCTIIDKSTQIVEDTLNALNKASSVSA